jgi:polysaccharide pyruvyl transferase WcaK-like protein
MHDQSGHFFRMLASLYAFKANGKKVISMNQTIDVKPGSLHAAMLQAVYPQLDAVLVREPLSHRLLNQLNIPNTVLGDAAYALPRLSEEEIEQHFRTFDIDTGFIALTASSILDRNARSIATMEKIIRALKPLGRRIVFLANTKTDLYLEKKSRNLIIFRSSATKMRNTNKQWRSLQKLIFSSEVVNTLTFLPQFIKLRSSD